MTLQLLEVSTENATILISSKGIFESDTKTSVDQIIRDTTWRTEHVPPYSPRTGYSKLTSVVFKSYAILITHLSDFSNLHRSLAERVEELTECQFDSLSLQHFRHGNDYTGFELNENSRQSCVALLFLGSRRNLIIKHRHLNQVYNFPLVDGSLVLLKGHEAIANYIFSVPKCQGVSSSRILCTFRQKIPSNEN